MKNLKSKIEQNLNNLQSNNQNQNSNSNFANFDYSNFENIEKNFNILKTIKLFVSNNYQLSTKQNSILFYRYSTTNKITIRYNFYIDQNFVSIEISKLQIFETIKIENFAKFIENFETKNYSIFIDKLFELFEQNNNQTKQSK